MFNWYHDLIAALREHPEPADVSSVIRATAVGALISAVNALIMFGALWPEFGGPWLIAWTVATMLISGLGWARSRRHAGYHAPYVSARTARRLKLLALVQALPWALMVFAMAGQPESQDRALAVLASCGMAAGAAFILHRTFAAATIYLTVLLGTVFVTAIAHDPGESWPTAAYALVFGAFLVHFAHRFGAMARERDRYVGDLSRVVADLEMANDWISTLAYSDTVTGLPNRKAFNDRLQIEAQRAAEGGAPIAVLLMDLDRFKNVNDTHGHHVGDRLLVEVAARLKQVVEPLDMVARLGGDEFVVLATLEEDRDPADLGDRIIAALKDPVQLGAIVVHTGSSIGCAICPRDTEDPAELLQKADIALNRAKETGRGRFLRFNRELSRSVDDAHVLAEALRAALARGEIGVRYQPKIDLATGAASGAEALVRWRHPLLGEVPPDRFLSVAADRGMMHQVTEAVFSVVFRDIEAWRRQGADVGKIAVNIHPVDLKAPEELFEILRKAKARGIGGDALMIEITEGCFVGRGADAALVLLDAIGELGFELSLDDFGTGHAALSHLRTLPVTEIKIDRSFISGLAEGRQDRAIVSATLAIARGMGLRSVAEGIETEEQLAILRELGADLGQGHLWSRSLTAPDLAAFARDRQAA